MAQRPIVRRLCHVLTVGASLRFLRGQPAFMRARGYETHVVCAPGPELERFAESEGAIPHPIIMSRSITPAADACTVLRLASLFRALNPSVVHAQTPKGGLLGVLAGRAANAPRVLYHMRGLPHRGRAGTVRGLLMATEWVACHLADQVICQSRSLRTVAWDAGLLSRRGAVVLGDGGNGVDADRFDRDRYRDAARSHRAELGIPESARVVGFVGRLVGDKGVAELVAAWRALRERFSDAHLVVVGPAEDGDALPATVLEQLRRDPRAHLTGEVDAVAGYYAVFDLLVLPTVREGFPNVLLEAAAMSLPVVASRVEGCVDAVIEGVTGALVPARSPQPLADAIGRYLEDRELRLTHGDAARAHVRERHSPGRIHAALEEVYRQPSERARARRWD